MGPTKMIIKGDALYDAKTSKLITKGLSTPQELQAYAAHHYIVLPVLDDTGHPWLLDGKPVYCLRGTRYETFDDKPVHLARCPDCGGMGIRMDEPNVESDCICCTQCGHEFDTRLQMMES